MKKILITVAAVAAVLLPTAADASPGHQHGGASHSRIDWD